MGTNMTRVFLISLRPTYGEKIKPKARNQLGTFPRQPNSFRLLIKYTANFCRKILKKSRKNKSRSCWKTVVKFSIDLSELFDK